MTADELRAWCLSLPGAVETFPFRPEVSVFKVGGKIFALSSLRDEPLDVSVKSDPALAEALRATHDAIVGGYHLNKRHWITITLNAGVGDPQVRDLVEASHALVAPRA